MLVNHDFTRRAFLRPADFSWVCSPQTGVDRVMLDRIGAEKARATSIVKYHPDSVFPEHQHPDGEEILVLSGVFSEGPDSYPAGWYLRNPPDSVHQPSSAEGALIFVKLRQMAQGRHDRVRLDTNDPANWRQGSAGAECPLFSNEYETVMLRRLAPHSRADFLPEQQGTELLILAGSLEDDNTVWPTQSWLRFPAGDTPELTSGDAGVLFYQKTGHLADSLISGVSP